MSDPIIYTLRGAICVGGKDDSIGLPLFQLGNEWFVAQCDEDLNIVAFAPFEDFADYEIDYDIVKKTDKTLFHLDEPIPIPYWYFGFGHIVSGSEDPRRFQRQWGNSMPRVAERIGRLLDEARTGMLHEVRLRRVEDTVKAGFREVFLEEPNYSKYWISRFAAACKRAAELKERSEALDEALRRKAYEWLAAFMSKADVMRIWGILGDKETSVFSRAERAEIIFAYCLHKLVGDGFSRLRGYIGHPLFTESFPDGLLGYFTEHGWPNLDIALRRPPHILEPMYRAIKAADQYEHNMNEWSAAEAMAALMFGRRDAPHEIRGLLEKGLNQERDRLRLEMNRTIERRNVRPLRKLRPHHLDGNFKERFFATLMMMNIINAENRLKLSKDDWSVQAMLRNLDISDYDEPLLDDEDLSNRWPET